MKNGRSFGNPSTKRSKGSRWAGQFLEHMLGKVRAWSSRGRKTSISISRLTWNRKKKLVTEINNDVKINNEALHPITSNKRSELHSKDDWYMLVYWYIPFEPSYPSVDWSFGRGWLVAASRSIGLSTYIYLKGWKIDTSMLLPEHLFPLSDRLRSRVSFVMLMLNIQAKI